jgi:UDP-N-acetylmuramoylalanine--D-glutamate ligase
MKSPNLKIENHRSWSLFDRLGLHPFDSRVLIVGLGTTGLSVARFLAGQGIEFAVVDSRREPPGLAELQKTLPDAAVFLGGLQPSAFAAATHLVISPGVPLDSPAINRSLRAGIPLLSDIDLFACMANAPVIAITGSNGKSTVTTLVGLMAREAGLRVGVGGNLGPPALDILDDEAMFYVLELSSFQLERGSLLEPVAATVLNISADHMDRYVDLAAYVEAKRRIFKGRGVMVLNNDDARVAAMAEPGRACLRFGLKDDIGLDYSVRSVAGAEWIVRRGEPLMPTAEIGIRGRHNVANALAALALGNSIGLPFDPMREVLKNFPGLDHRMQWVAEIDGITYINDSKATNVGACVAALDGLPGKAVLLAGGDGKGADFSVLAPVAAKTVRAAVLMGRDAPLLEEALAPVVPVVRAATMRQGVRAARALARPGDTVLLAPACASLDQYTDYQERGRVFAEAVRSMR